MIDLIDLLANCKTLQFWLGVKDAELAKSRILWIGK